MTRFALSLPKFRRNRLFASVAWKIALIAVGPVLGLALTIGLWFHAERLRKASDDQLRVISNEFTRVDDISSALALVQAQVSSYLESRSYSSDRDIIVGVANVQKGLDGLKTSSDAKSLELVAEAEKELGIARSRFEKLKAKVEEVGRTGEEGLTEDLDSRTELLVSLFEGALANHQGFRPLMEAFMQLRSIEMRYRWKRDPRLESKIGFQRTILLDNLKLVSFDKSVAEAIHEDLSKQGQTFYLWRNGIADERMFRDELISTLKKIGLSAVDLKDRIDARQNEARKEALAVDTLASIYNLAAAAVSALLAFAFILLIGRNLAAALSRLAGSMRRVADGEQDVAIPHLGRQDEIGTMAGALQVFQASISERAALSAAAEREAEARLARARRIEAEIGTFGNLIEQALSQLKGRAAAMGQASDELDANSVAVTQQAAVAGQATEAAAREVSSVAVAAEQLSKSVTEVSQQAVRSAEVAERAVSQSQRASAMMGELATEAMKIGDVVELIRSIAGQTNLLALNATIEAARAGEAGRGFAVVASEVKALASQTAKATDEIVDKIHSIQSASGDVSGAITQIGEILAEMSQIATSVASAVDEQSSAIATISENVNDAARSSNEGSSAIRDAEARALASRATAKEVAGAAQAVAAESDTIETRISGFLNEVRAA